MNRNKVTATVIQIMTASQTFSHAVMNAIKIANTPSPSTNVTGTQINKSILNLSGSEIALLVIGRLHAQMFAIVKVIDRIDVTLYW
jgi:hypothetical protein